MMTAFQEHYGPYALITGASSGIGEQFAHLLAKRGLHLLITGRNEAALKQLSEQLTQEHGIHVQYLAADLSKATDVQSLIQTAQSLPLGLIVSNAGFGLKGEFEQLTHDDMHAMYLTNCIHPSQLIHALLPQLSRQQHGGVILTGSIEGETPFPYSAAYAASKGFIHQFAMSLAIELKPKGVDVVLLAPGSTDTAAPIKQGFTRDQLPGLMSPQAVAEQALNALGKKHFVITGWQNRLSMAFLRLLPRALAAKLAGQGLKQAMEKNA